MAYTLKKISILTLVLSLFLISCENDDNNTPNTQVSFNFTHTWDGTAIDNNNLTSINVTNQNGEIMNFTRIRYLVSRFELVSVQTGTSYSFEGYKFTDVSDNTTYNFTPTNNTIPSGDYRLNFIWGFNEEDNIDGEYVDLNSASWNWPSQLGGGYHFLQMDGQYNINTTPSNYNFHNGTARASTNPSVYEQNFAEISLDEIIAVSDNNSIEVIMNFAEFFKNPNTWNLNALDTPLMPNYMAQKMMQENVGSVFSITESSAQ